IYFFYGNGLQHFATCSPIVWVGSCVHHCFWVCRRLPRKAKTSSV
ncbi:hypothetical protein MTO96_050896, partial [Rhipicephalus appendiculatus]